LCWTRICQEPQRQHWRKRSAVEKRERKGIIWYKVKEGKVGQLDFVDDFWDDGEENEELT
jgi:hypothetical protein